METKITLPTDFEEKLNIPNAPERLREAEDVGKLLIDAGIPLMNNADHYAIFSEPPRLLSEGLKKVGYVVGSDNRCYPSPVDGCDYINVSASLPDELTNARDGGWPDHIAVVHPLDELGFQRMVGQGYGNPFIHHITWGIKPPTEKVSNEINLAGNLVERMAQIRQKISIVLKQKPGTLIMALPKNIVESRDFQKQMEVKLGKTPLEECQIEVMEGGGFLLQFFVLTGGRIEVALRVGTQQTFNPKSVHKISKDELSVDQGQSSIREIM